jgi:hypothetical protein
VCAFYFIEANPRVVVDLNFVMDLVLKEVRWMGSSATRATAIGPGHRTKSISIYLLIKEVVFPWFGTSQIVSSVQPTDCSFVRMYFVRGIYSGFFVFVDDVIVILGPKQPNTTSPSHGIVSYTYEWPFSI